MKIFIANWKMELAPTEAEKRARAFVRVFKEYKGEAVVCPDYLSLASVAKIFKSSPLRLGAQDAAAHERGAYTGEVSAADLSSLGVKYVLIGHSERRNFLAESNKLLAEKIKMVLAGKMVPVLCVGENAAEKKQGRAASVIREQLQGALKSLPANTLHSLVIAYEPVWAIGTGVNCDPASAAQIRTIIREWCLRIGLKKVTVLYGGSVKPENAASFIGAGGFDGLLVGGASLEASSFKKITNV